MIQRIEMDSIRFTPQAVADILAQMAKECAERPGCFPMLHGYLWDGERRLTVGMKFGETFVEINIRPGDWSLSK